MNILDEDISAPEREQLRTYKIQVRQIGVEIGRSGMKDHREIIPLLHRLKGISTMVSEEDRLVVKRFKSLLLEHGVPLQSVVLFGSRARGDHSPDSDYDVLVVVDRLDPTIGKTVSRCAWEAGFADCLLIVPVVVAKDEIDKSPFRASLLMQAVREEGTVI